MEKLTYRTYCEDPTVRQRIDAEVLKLRRQAVRGFIVDPLVRLFERVTSVRQGQRRYAANTPKSA